MVGFYLAYDQATEIIGIDYALTRRYIIVGRGASQTGRKGYNKAFGLEEYTRSLFVVLDLFII
jgi:hypothetical protein